MLHLWNQADSVFDAYKQEVKSSINASQVSAQTWTNNQEAPAMNINGHSCVLVLLYSCAVQEISSLLDNTANFEVGHVRYPAAVAWLNTLAAMHHDLPLLLVNKMVLAQDDFRREKRTMPELETYLQRSFTRAVTRTQPLKDRQSGHSRHIPLSLIHI